MGENKLEIGKRVIYLDVLRIVAIFAVIVLHVSASNLFNIPINGFNWQVFNVYDSMVRFCVPVFIMISGVLFLDPRREIKVERLFKHNIRRLIIAFIFWSLLYACYGTIDKILNGVSIDKNLIIYFIKEFIYGHYHMTFLYIIIGLYLIVPLLRKITADKKLTQYFIMLAFVFCYMVNILIYIPTLGNVVSTLSTKININFVLGYTCYFVVGYYLNRYDLKSRTKKIVYFLAIISLILTIIGTSVWSLKLGKATENLYRYLLPTTFFISVAIFIGVKEKFSKIKLKDKTTNIMEKVSKLTFGIYLVHDFFNIFLQKIGIITTAFNPIISVPVISIIVFLCSLIASYTISKNKVLKKYII